MNDKRKTNWSVVNMNKLIYLAGDMLSLGQQKQRAEEKEKLEAIGYSVYSPQDDKSINDKKNANQDGLAERIVQNDFNGINQSDMAVVDYLPHAQGTIAEIGMLYYHKLLNPTYTVYVHCTDIRQGTGHLPQDPNRVEFSVNQFVNGLILFVTDGIGIQSFNEICNELEEQ